MKVDFSFRLGWSEVLSALAIALAAIAVLQTRDANRPDIDVVAQPPFAGIVDTPEGRRFIALQRVTITNTGGRAVSLLHITPDSVIGPFVAVRKGLLSSDLPAIAVFRVRERADVVLKDVRILLAYRDEGFHSLYALNEVIASGEAKTINLGVMIEADTTNPRFAERILHASVIYFSNGDRRPLRQAYTLAPERIRD